MTQIWKGDNVIAVTKLQAGPCRVSQIRTKEKDTYEAVQLAYGERKTKNIAKPQLGHLRKAGEDISAKKCSQHLREFRTAAVDGLKLGAVVTADTFAAGDQVEVIGTSKGKGFQGVVKRHGFKGADEQHGNKDQSRMPGSIGATGPAHVFKGTRMGGRMGDDRVTIKGLEVIEVDTENGFIYIKGGVPGARNSLVLIQGEGDLKFTTGEEQPAAKEEEAKEEAVAETAPEAVAETSEAPKE